MPKRVNKKFKRVDTAPMMGEGSFVRIRKPGFDALGNIMALASLSVEDGKADLSGVTPETIAGVYSLLAETVVEWNWVDDDDQPLPQPGDDPEVFQRELNLDEVQYLIEQLDLGGADPKN